MVLELRVFSFVTFQKFKDRSNVHVFCFKLFVLKYLQKIHLKKWLNLKSQRKGLERLLKMLMKHL